MDRAKTCCPVFKSFKGDTSSSKSSRSNSCSNSPLAERNDEFPSDHSEDTCDRSKSLAQVNDDFATDRNEEQNDCSQPLAESDDECPTDHNEKRTDCSESLAESDDKFQKSSSKSTNESVDHSSSFQIERDFESELLFLETTRPFNSEVEMLFSKFYRY